MRRLDTALGALLRGIAILCLTGLFALILVNVIARTFQLAGFAWFDELVQAMFAWMVFIGSAALWREHEHFRVGWLAGVVPLGIARPLALFVIVLEILFLLAMTRYGYDLTLRSRALTPILKFPTGLMYAAIPLSGAVMLAYSVRDFIVTFRSPPTHKRTTA